MRSQHHFKNGNNTTKPFYNLCGKVFITAVCFIRSLIEIIIIITIITLMIIMITTIIIIIIIIIITGIKMEKKVVKENCQSHPFH